MITVLVPCVFLLVPCGPSLYLVLPVGQSKDYGQVRVRVSLVLSRVFVSLPLHSPTRLCIGVLRRYDTIFCLGSGQSYSQGQVSVICPDCNQILCRTFITKLTSQTIQPFVFYPCHFSLTLFPVLLYTTCIRSPLLVFVAVLPMTSNGRFDQIVVQAGSFLSNSRSRCDSCAVLKISAGDKYSCFLWTFGRR